MATKSTAKRPEKRQPKASKPRPELEINLRARRVKKTRLILGTPTATAGSLARVVRQFHREREAGLLSDGAVRAYRAEARLFSALLEWRRYETDLGEIAELRRRLDELEAQR